MAQVLEIAIREDAAAAVVFELGKELLRVDADDQRALGRHFRCHRRHAPVPPAIARQEHGDLLHRTGRPVDLDVLEPPVGQRFGVRSRDHEQGQGEAREQRNHGRDGRNETRTTHGRGS